MQPPHAPDPVQCPPLIPSIPIISPTELGNLHRAYLAILCPSITINLCYICRDPLWVLAGFINRDQEADQVSMATVPQCGASTFFAFSKTLLIEFLVISFSKKT